MRCWPSWAEALVGRRMALTMDELLDAARWRGDEPADRLMESLARDVDPEHLLDYLQNTARLCSYMHLENEPGHPGDPMHSRRAPPEFEAFLATSFQAPAWLDPQRVARGAELFRRHVAAASLALGAASLPTCYCWTREAQVLILTQRLARDVPRRILETAQFVLDVMSRDGLRLGLPYARGVPSAFNSAGQRCSALRILCVQKDIFPRVATLLDGAMQQLRLGDPALLDTDIGPVIDREAFDMLLAHRERMSQHFKAIGQTRLPRDIPPGHFFAPCAFAIESFDDIKSEVFGPVLHVLPFEAEQLMDVVDAINASGFGLTLGIHSRIEETIRAIRARARVGNVYVNRNQIGAVVGVQPFGGEGLSGTGPKAGGPHYLFRFASERTFTVNTAAAGGNAALIASSE